MPRSDDDERLSLLRRALNAVDTGVVVLSADLDRLLLTNKAAERMVGRSLTTALRRVLARVKKTRRRGELKSAPCLVMIRRVPRWVSLQQVGEPIPLEIALIESADGETQLVDVDLLKMLSDVEDDD